MSDRAPATAPVHLRWVDDVPPPRNEALLVNHAVIAAALREHPGRWAMLPDLNPTYAHSINGGTNTAYRPGGSFEATSRQGVLYARYVGGG